MSSTRGPGDLLTRDDAAVTGLSGGRPAVYGETIRSTSPVGGMVRAARSGQEPTIGHVPVRPQGPTALRIVLGNQLRQLREAAGVTAGAAGHAIRASHAKISRMELGRV